MTHMKKVLISFLALATIGLISFSTPQLAAAQWNNGVQGGATSARGVDQPTELFGDGGMFQKVSNILLYIIGAVSVIMIIFGGFRYVTSGGNSDNITTAKNTILYAIVGIVVALLAYAAVQFVITSFATGGGTGTGATGF